MGSWVFRTARKICLIVFGADIFVHAVIGACSINGIMKGTLSMITMLVLLIVLSKDDLKRKVSESRKKRKGGSQHE